MTIERDAAIAASGARALQTWSLPDEFEVSTDTRTLLPGDVFVALRGASFDGHAFVAEAAVRGAAAVVVSDESAVPEGVAALVVADTTAALLAFAGLARARSHAKVVAITGSAGKTTTKALLTQLLQRATEWRVAATFANENNEFGVAKLLLGLDESVEAVVVEFGARKFGEIEPLARAARPDVAVLTNIGDAHLEIMGSPNGSPRRSGEFSRRVRCRCSTTTMPFRASARRRWASGSSGSRFVRAASPRTSRWARARHCWSDASAWSCTSVAARARST